MPDGFKVVLLSDNEVDKYLSELRLKAIHPNWFRPSAPEPTPDKEEVE